MRDVWTRELVSVVASISLACYIPRNFRTRDNVSVTESVSFACYITRTVRIRDFVSMGGDQKCTVRVILAVQRLRNLLLVRQRRSMENNMKTN